MSSSTRSLLTPPLLSLSVLNWNRPFLISRHTKRVHISSCTQSLLFYTEINWHFGTYFSNRPIKNSLPSYLRWIYSLIFCIYLLQHCRSLFCFENAKRLWTCLFMHYPGNPTSSFLPCKIT